ncbi:MAG: LysR family transcriptional regulator [Clostridiales bacterium]|nr:LysR family transcriptional regulator [Clostridiales bacterium]
MNSRQLQYIVRLAETLHFSQVAEELNISQPALSKQVIHLENELGVKLFERTTPLTITDAGRFFVEKARKLLMEEELLLKTMERYKSGDNGSLTIGITPFRSLYLMPGAIKGLRERFPQLKISLAEQGLSRLQKGLLDGEYDFAIMNLPVDETVFEAFPMEPDKLVLAVPDTLLPLIAGPHEDIISSPKALSACASLPFVALTPEQEMRKLFDRLCAIAGIEPQLFAEVTGVTTARQIVLEGLAASLLPRLFIENEAKQNHVTLFELPEVSYSRQPAVVIRRGQYVSEYARYAMDLLLRQI